MGAWFNLFHKKGYAFHSNGSVCLTDSKLSDNIELLERRLAILVTKGDFKRKHSLIIKRIKALKYDSVDAYTKVIILTWIIGIRSELAFGIN